MMDTLTCSNCGMDNAYHNGVCYECPDCDHEWGGTESKKDENDWYREDGLLEYERHEKRSEPFFQLKHGQLYECMMDYANGSEMVTIIPLAFDAGKNRQYILFDGKKVAEKRPDYLTEIISMDFDYIWHDGIENDDIMNHILTDICATTEEGTLINQIGDVFSEFREISVTE